MYKDINETLNRIKKSGLFKMEQLGVIEFAIYRPEISVDEVKLILNPTIPSKYMSMYVRLMMKGINVKKYIERNWELKEIPVYDLEKAIIAENKDKIDINKATITEEVIDIKSAIVTEEVIDIKSAIVTEEKPKINIKKRNII